MAARVVFLGRHNLIHHLRANGHIAAAASLSLLVCFNQRNHSRGARPSDALIPGQQASLHLGGQRGAGALLLFSILDGLRQFPVDAGAFLFQLANLIGNPLLVLLELHLGVLNVVHDGQDALFLERNLLLLKVDFVQQRLVLLVLLYNEKLPLELEDMGVLLLDFTLAVTLLQAELLDAVLAFLEFGLKALALDAETFLLAGNFLFALLQSTYFRVELLELKEFLGGARDRVNARLKNF